MVPAEMLEVWRMGGAGSLTARSAKTRARQEAWRRFYLGDRCLWIWVAGPTEEPAWIRIGHEVSHFLAPPWLPSKDSASQAPQGLFPRSRSWSCPRLLRRSRCNDSSAPKSASCFDPDPIQADTFQPHPSPPRDFAPSNLDLTEDVTARQILLGVAVISF